MKGRCESIRPQGRGGSESGSGIVGLGARSPRGRLSCSRRSTCTFFCTRSAGATAISGNNSSGGGSSSSSSSPCWRRGGRRRRREEGSKALVVLVSLSLALLQQQPVRAYLPLHSLQKLHVAPGREEQHRLLKQRPQQPQHKHHRSWTKSLRMEGRRKKSSSSVEGGGDGQGKIKGMRSGVSSRISGTRSSRRSSSDGEVDGRNANTDGKVKRASKTKTTKVTSKRAKTSSSSPSSSTTTRRRKRASSTAPAPRPVPPSFPESTVEIGSDVAQSILAHISAGHSLGGGGRFRVELQLPELRMGEREAAEAAEAAVAAAAAAGGRAAAAAAAAAAGEEGEGQAEGEEREARRQPEVGVDIPMLTLLRGLVVKMRVQGQAKVKLFFNTADTARHAREFFEVHNPGLVCVDTLGKSTITETDDVVVIIRPDNMEDPAKMEETQTLCIRCSLMNVPVVILNNALAVRGYDSHLRQRPMLLGDFEVSYYLDSDVLTHRSFKVALYKTFMFDKWLLFYTDFRSPEEGWRPFAQASEMPTRQAVRQLIRSSGIASDEDSEEVQEAEDEADVEKEEEERRMGVPRR